jgi:L-ascorbate metabolism protein UlaG (beta-lactamase superfamily)
MTISWYGQACFRIESKDVRVLIDPFSAKIGLRAPRINDQIILVTHDHHDHNNVEDVGAETFVIRGPGEYEKSGVQIVGVNSYHDNVQGAERGLNTIYILKMEDIRICHLGDLGQHELTDEQISLIGSVDILMVPVGGKYTIDGTEASAIVKQIDPKIIIPMHYKVSGLTIEGLEGPQTFLKEIGIKPEEVETLKIQAKNLPQEEIKLITFKL